VSCRYSQTVTRPVYYEKVRVTNDKIILPALLHKAGKMIRCRWIRKKMHFESLSMTIT